MQAEIIALKKQLVEKDAKLAEKDTETRRNWRTGCTERYIYVRSLLYSTTKNNATRDGRLWSMWYLELIFMILDIDTTDCLAGEIRWSFRKNPSRGRAEGSWMWTDEHCNAEGRVV
jgi:hypothetical protein